MSTKTILTMAAFIGVAGGAYWFGTQRAAPPAPTVGASAPAAPAAKEAAPAQRPPLPASHPPLADAASGVARTMQQYGATPAPAAARKFTHFRVGNRNVKAMLADGPLVWVGTSGGVIRYELKTDKHQLFDNKTGLLANGIFYLGKLGGRLAVGTYGGGMSLLNAADQSWETFNIPEGLADAFVYDAMETRDGDIWIATWSGANRVRGGALKDRSRWDLFTVENTQGGLPNNWVYALHEGRNGEIWLATEGGLARFQNGAWQNWSHKDGLGAAYEVVKDQLQFENDPARVSEHHARQKVEQGLEKVNVAYNPNYIVALHVDREGVVWAGTWGGGLGRFDGQKWTNYTTRDGLPANHVFMLHEDPQGRLWIGTSNGIARRDGDAFKSFGTGDGLFSKSVFSMAVTEDGGAWVGSYGGVARFAELP